MCLEKARDEGHGTRCVLGALRIEIFCFASLFGLIMSCPCLTGSVRAALPTPSPPPPPPRVCIGCLVGLSLPLPPLSSREVRFVDQSKATSFLTSSPRLIVHPPRHPHTSHTRSSGHPLPSPSAPCHVQVPIFSSVTLSLIPPPPPSTTQAAGANLCPLCPSFPHRNALHSFSRMPHRKTKQSVLSAPAPGAPKKPPPTLETLLAPPPLR